MEESTSREKVLKKVRKALINKSPNFVIPNVDFESSVFVKSDESLEIQFAQNFTEALGKFVFCLDEQEAVENLQYLANENKWSSIITEEEKFRQIIADSGITLSPSSEFENAAVIVTSCEYLVARTGSILVSSRQSAGRKLPFIANVHIVFAYTSQLVEDMKEALKKIKSKHQQLPSMFTFITGPSRTTDIESSLIVGMHGPKEVYVFLIDDFAEEQ